MKHLLGLIFLTTLLGPHVALAIQGDHFLEERKCAPPRHVELKVHATYLDQGVLMCALEIENYSSWDLIKKSSDQKYRKDFWFPCSQVSQTTGRGSKVGGTLSWNYEVSCLRCSLGWHHSCEATFDLD